MTKTYILNFVKGPVYVFLYSHGYLLHRHRDGDLLMEFYYWEDPKYQYDTWLYEHVGDLLEEWP